MDKLKLISVRIDPFTLAKIDEYCKSRLYLKRNAVINRLLYVVFSCSSPSVLHRMLTTYPYELDKYDLVLNRKKL